MVKKMQGWNISGKMVICLCFIFLFFLAGCEDTREPVVDEPPEKIDFTGTIIAVGDSLTAGYGLAEEEAYPARLRERLREDGYDFHVINAGISGETSSGTLSRIKWILAQKPDIVILETGANDGLRGIKTDLIKENISGSVQMLKENNAEVILAGMQMVQNLGAGYTGTFAEIYPEIAREQDILLIPFFLKGVAGVPSLNQADTIHPTAEGYKIVAETIYPYVLQAIKRLKSGTADDR
jgi:acyl-CoA thioesterase-1